jgi:hypothetical protein
LEKFTGEAFSPLKRPSSTSKHENSLLFFYIFAFIFALLDPDPSTQINEDPCGSGSFKSWAVYGTIFRITVRPGANFPATGGFLNAATSSVKRVTGRIFLIRVFKKQVKLGIRFS